MRKLLFLLAAVIFCCAISAGGQQQSRPIEQSKTRIDELTERFDSHVQAVYLVIHANAHEIDELKKVVSDNADALNSNSVRTERELMLLRNQVEELRRDVDILKHDSPKRTP